MKKEMGINKSKMLRKEAGISFLQIFILIVSSFAFAYIIAMADSDISKEASAATALNCCETDNSGSPCNEYPSDTCDSKCSKGCAPSLCAQTAGCEVGCCYDSDNGICSAQSSKGKCMSEGGNWTESADCNVNQVPECRLGCCVLGSETRFVTKGMCEKLSGFPGRIVNFRAGITSEAACVLLSMADNRGACLLAGNGCKMLTNSECRALTSRNIVANKLCTAVSLNTTCKKTQETTCVEGKDEVYFKDSCGNAANIYDSGRINNQSYWENVIQNYNSCNYLSGNINSKECGNCKYDLGSKCKNYKDAETEKARFGESICSDVRCNDAPYVVDNFGKITETKDRQNGESWCVYDGKIGDGDDIPGSRHWKYSCIDGEAKMESCADARNEICVESEIAPDFSNAVCRANNWRECISTDFGNCTNKLDCAQKSVVIDKFRTELCTPKYPEGFGSSVENQQSAQQICSQATKTCVIKRKKVMGKCVEVENKGCKEAGFTQQMNDVCRSLGDCGGEVNIAGKYTQNFLVKSAPGLSPGWIAKLVALAISRGGQKGEVGNVNPQLSAAGLSSSEAREQVVGLSGVSYSSLWNQLTTDSSDSRSSVTGNVVLTGDVVDTGGLESPDYVRAISAGGTGAGGVEASAIAEMMQGLPLPMEVVLEGAGYSLGTAPIPLESLVMPTGGIGVGPGIGTGAYELGNVIPGMESVAIDPWGGTVANPTGPVPPIAPAIAGFIGGVVGGILGGMLGSALANKLGLNPTGSFLMSTGMGMIGGALGGAALSAAFAPAAVGGFGAAFSTAMTTGIFKGIFGPTFLPFITPQFLLIVGAIMIIASFFFGGMKCPPKIVTYTCQPWQAPVGGDDCSKCNANPDSKPCSKYRCESLGKACMFINEGTEKEMCVSIANNNTAPKITPWQEILWSMSGNLSYINASEKGVLVRESNGNCIQSFTPILFGIKTDKPSQCKVDLISRKNYEEMENYFGESNLFVFNHSQGFSIPSVESLVEYLNDSNFTAQFVLDKIGNLRMYVRCQDVFGNYNPAEYVIDLCLRKGPDRTAPLILATTPATGSFIKYNQTNENVTAYINEYSTCRWSKQDKDYDLMENSMNCIRGLAEGDNFGGICNSMIGNLTASENNIYIRCKDKPELAGINESERNKNTQSYQLILKKTMNALSITRIAPNGTFSFGSEPMSIALEVQTSGGAENGKSACSYFWNNRAILFRYTLAGTHRQVLDGMVRGNYNILVRCEDIAGNYDEERARFNLVFDNSPPVVTRAYDSGGSLYIVTNENSECAYTNNILAYPNCQFSFENGTKMSGGFSQEHTTAWDISKTYYIKCRDAWGREPAGCSIKAMPFIDY